jgi:hypothetical protein
MKHHSLYQRTAATYCGCAIVAALLASATTLAQQEGTAKVAGEVASAAQAIQPPEAVIAEAASAGSQSRRLMSNKLMIFWSEARDVVWGFSNSLGRWTRQELNPPAPAGPQLGTSGIVVGDNVAVWRVGSTYYAYSGQTGRWDVLRLPEGRTPPPEVHEELVLVHDGGDVHTFAAATGRWWSPNGQDTTGNGQPEEANIKVFTLRHAKASEAERLITQLFPRDIQSVAADQRTNTLIVRGGEETLKVIFALLTRLDEQAGATSSAPAAGRTRGPSATPASIAGLAKQYESEERKAAALARQIEEQRTAAWPDKAKVETLSADLRRAVAAAFAARQQLHRAEVSQLQERTAAVQRNLEMREKLSEQIIDRRIKDLLNPDTEWESRSRTAGPAAKSAGGGAFTSSAPQPTVTIGRHWPAESLAVIKSLGLEVKRVTLSDATDPQLARLVGALQITAIAPDSPASELQVGDFIRAIQSTGAAQGSGRRVVLLDMQRRTESGILQFSAAVEFPGQQPAGATAEVDVSSNSPATDLTAARAYRDKLRERWQQIQKLYENGRFPLDELLRGAKELAEAELAAAENRDERMAALVAAVERLKQVKAIVDPKFAADVEPEYVKLAVDAELLKAEAVMNAATGR